MTLTATLVRLFDEAYQPQFDDAVDPDIAMALHFDMQNPSATAWAESRAAELVKQISDGQMQFIRDLLHESFLGGMTPTEVAMKLRMVIGLTTQQSQYITSYYDRLIGQGIAPEKALQLSMTYRKRWVQYRANMIARTETVAASNSGQVLAWQEAIKAGYLDPMTMQYEWIISPDSHTCMACREMAGKRFPFGSGIMPPKHPACRCSLGVVRVGSPPAQHVTVPPFVPRQNVYKFKPKVPKSALKKHTEPSVTAAGLAVVAADSGRVLMLQRSNEAVHDDGSVNKAPGMWEFPGGNLEDGESPFDGARREWEEETGRKLPPGVMTGSWTSGIYKGFSWQVPDESYVHLNPDDENRHIINPDDPDGDWTEVVAWWDPDTIADNPVVRQELRDSFDSYDTRVKTPDEIIEDGQAYVETLDSE